MLRRTLCVLRWLCLPVLAFWSFIFVTLTLIISQPSPLPPPPTVDPLVALDEFVDRDAICDRLQRGVLDREPLNSSVLDACRRWIAAQTVYFRPRPQRVNTFRRRLLKTGAGICSDRTFLVVVVHSLHTHADRRAAIRETWGAAAVTGVWPQSLSRVCTPCSSRTVSLRLLSHLFSLRPLTRLFSN